MRASSGYKIIITMLFVVIGLPPGLCSLYFTPFAIGSLGGGGQEGAAYVALFAVPCLVGFAIFGILLWLLIRAWRRTSP